MMRNFLWLILLAPLLWAEARYSIQVLSVKKKSSITEEFMQRVKKISLPYTQKHIDGYHKVFIGEFQTRAAAASVLAKVRESVQANAFITVEREGPVLKPRQKMQQAMLMAKARTLKKMKEDESKHITKELAAVSPIKVSGPQEEIVVVKKDIKRVVEKVEDVKTKEALSKEAPQNLFCKSSKKSLREAEISEALAFYQGSSYYRFRE